MKLDYQLLRDTIRQKLNEAAVKCLAEKKAFFRTTAMKPKTNMDYGSDMKDAPDKIRGVGGKWHEKGTPEHTAIMKMRAEQA